MSNPNNAVGTNAAYDGRTSVNAFNDDLSVYSRGVMSGWSCVPSSGLVVALGGDGNTRDVAVAQDNAGNKTTINNISGSPISVTIPAAPASNSRIDLIVAYVDNPPVGASTTADNPTACGLIVVSGTAAANPTQPSENDIRTAITGDGASGATAYYVILAVITIASGTTTLTSSNIANGSVSTLNVNNLNFAGLNFGNYSTSEVNTGFTWVDGKYIYKKSIYVSGLPNTAGSIQIAHGISNLDKVINIEGCYTDNNGYYAFPANSPISSSNADTYIRTNINGNDIQISVGMDRSSLVGYATLYYTKN